VSDPVRMSYCGSDYVCHGYVQDYRSERVEVDYCVDKCKNGTFHYNLRDQSCYCNVECGYGSDNSYLVSTYVIGGVSNNVMVYVISITIRSCVH
jgi:hypothetical protein